VDVRGKFDMLYAKIKTLDRGYRTRTVPNPAYVAPVEGQPLPVVPQPESLTERVPLSTDDIRALKYDIRDICGPLAGTLSK
jgi:hypothetical protein